MNSFRTYQRAALAIALFALVALFQQTASAQDPMIDGVEKNSAGPLWASSGIQGVWNVKVRIMVCQTGATILSFDAMSIFGKDGTFHDTNSTNPALRSAAFGTWQPLPDGRYYFAFRFFRFDAAGNPLGSQIIRHYVNLGVTGDSYSSAGTAQFYDAAGNLFATGCSTSTATRFY